MPFCLFLQAGGTARFNCGRPEIFIFRREDQRGWTEMGGISCDYVLSHASTLLTYTDMIGLKNLPKKASGPSPENPRPVPVYCLLGFECEPADLWNSETTNFISRPA